ncbi:hypothetical protein [Micromonospora sp. NPDC005171]
MIGPQRQTSTDALHAAYPDVVWHRYADWARTVDWNRVLSRRTTGR